MKSQFLLSCFLPLTHIFCSLMSLASLFLSPSQSPGSIPPLPLLPICSAVLEHLPFSRGPCMSLLGTSMFISFIGSADCMLEFLMLCLKSTYEWVDTMVVFLRLVTSLRMVSPRAIHFTGNLKIPLIFFSWVVLLCVNVPHQRLHGTVLHHILNWMVLNHRLQVTVLLQSLHGTVLHQR